jgi:N-acetylglucosamine kinase-like BadF-type ATPase
VALGEISHITSSWRNTLRDGDGPVREENEGPDPHAHTRLKSHRTFRLRKVTHQRYILAMHGDRTRTQAVVVTMDGVLSAVETYGPADLQALGYERAAETIVGIAIDCCQKLGCRSSDLYAVAIGLAGGDTESDRAEFHNRILPLSRRERFPLNLTIVESNHRVALEAAFASGPGILLSVGMESVACAKGEDGQIHHAGGGANPLGGEGARQALCLEALKAVVRAHDGRGAKTRLRDYAHEHFGDPSIDDLVIKINRGQVDVSPFFPMVLRASTEGDHVAHGILFRGAGELTELARALTLRIQPRRKLPISLTGELLEGEDVYAKLVKDRILHSLPQLVVQKPKFPPAFGGVILALHPFEFMRKSAAVAV